LHEIDVIKRDSAGFPTSWRWVHDPPPEPAEAAGKLLALAADTGHWELAQEALEVLLGPNDAREDPT
jgi:hypothetical protein